MNMITILTISLCLISLMLMMSKQVKENNLLNKEDSSTFECGFDMQSNKNITLPSQFFMICVMFIIFDLEISIIIPILKSNTSFTFTMMNILMIMTILLTATLKEWFSGLLEWNK